VVGESARLWVGIMGDRATERSESVAPQAARPKDPSETDIWRSSRLALRMAVESQGLCLQEDGVGRPGVLLLALPEADAVRPRVRGF
jgi:hypothetical protein